MTETETKLNFLPVHPLNFPLKKLIEEREHQSQRWPEVTRVLSIYEDSAANLAILVSFRPADHAGNVDRVRCYNAVVGPLAGIAHPLSALGDTIDLAEAVESKYLKKLTQFFGDPGQPAPERFDAS